MLVEGQLVRCLEDGVTEYRDGALLLLLLKMAQAQGLHEAGHWLPENRSLGRLL